jgi:plastocyanin
MGGVAVSHIFDAASSISLEGKGWTSLGGGPAVRFRPISGRTVRMSGLSQRVGAAFVLVATLALLSPKPAEAYVTRVEVAKMQFSPARVQIEMGDSIIWEAADDGHTVTARDGTFDSSSRGLMAAGDQYRWRFRTPGSYAYFCRVHGDRGMKGEIVVVDPTTTSTRLTPVSAAATTSSTASPLTTAPTAPATTTTRPLATSSTTSPAVATSTTALVGTPVAPQEPPAINPSTPVVGTAEADAKLPGAQAAAQRSAADDDLLPLAAIGVVGMLALFGGVMGLRTRRRRVS